MIQSLKVNSEATAEHFREKNNQNEGLKSNYCRLHEKVLLLDITNSYQHIE